MKIPSRRIQWRPAFRIIPSRYPVVNLFAPVAKPSDLGAVLQLEALTSARDRENLSDESGQRYVDAVFSYPNPQGSRFSAGSYGVYYAARSLVTAIRETSHHRQKFMASTKEKPMMLGMRVLVATLTGRLHDIRRLVQKLTGVYHPASYAVSQSFGQKWHQQGSNGIVYRSVRHTGGECAAVFKPNLLNHCRQERHLLYKWDGKRISHVFEIKEYASVK